MGTKPSPSIRSGSTVQLQFSIRAMLMLTAVTSMCALLVHNSHWLAAVGFTIASVLAWSTLQPWPTLSWKGRHAWLRSALFFSAATFAWFSLVDLSYWSQWCPECEEHRIDCGVRVAGFSLWTTRGVTHDNYLSRLRADLGMPCEHKMDCQELIRFWGLIVPGSSGYCGTCCFAMEPGYYDDQLSSNIRDFARRDPKAAQAVFDRVVTHRNYDAMHEFIEEMKAAHPSTELLAN